MAAAPASTLDEARDALRTALRAGQGGTALAVQFADVVDSVVCEHAKAAFERSEIEPAQVCLGAVGGLGRRELAPYSDLDLVVLAPDLDDAAIEALVRELVHPLWDAGMRANVRADHPSAWLADAASDITSCTGLLDLRPLLGNAEHAESLRAQAFDEFLGPRRAEFLDRLDVEAQERHERYGGTVYLVEPDLKHGPGGLRDLASLEWALRAAHRTADLGQLAADEHLPPNMAALLQEARDVLLKLRIALHLAAKRSQERLGFSYQELLPPLMGRVPPKYDDATLVEAVERTMQEYYRAARALLRYGQRVRDRSRPRRDFVSMIRRLDDRFSIARGRLVYTADVPLADAPVQCFGALARARDRHVSLAGETFDAIAEAFAVPAAVGIADDRAAHAAFFELLINTDDVEHPSAVELASELGLLEAVVPEFGEIRGRMQHDTYHVYTVDQHTLAALAMLKRIARGDHNKDYPLATSLHLELDDPRVLYLATLVHDTGKADTGRDQCESGREVAWETARRLGLCDADVERCSMLVAEHLAMPLLSQKRDLSDPDLIAALARRVGSPRGLAELYLLSLVDTASVRPGNLTSWKLALLDELYLLARAHMRRGFTRVPQQEAAQDEPVGMPARYRNLFDADLRNHHGALVQQMLAQGEAVDLELDVGAGGLRLTLAGLDRPGLLAQTCAVFREHGVEIMAADIFSSDDVPSVVVDVFRVLPRGEAERGISPETVELMRTQLLQPWGQAELQRRPPERPSRAWSARPRTPTTVTFEDASESRTIIEVETEAEADTLERITLAMAAEGIEILLARINTEAERAVDTFYVERLGEDEQRRLTDRLADYLDPGG
ncbi:MAG: HD domain-containing protein [Nannocystaceae bacterium]|nr:HD domain-containing protein [bacterium]